MTKGLAIEATAIIAREKAEELLGWGWSELALDRCAQYLTSPGISVVEDARLALAAGGVHAMHDPTEGGVATGLLEMATASRVGWRYSPANCRSARIPSSSVRHSTLTPLVSSPPVPCSSAAPQDQQKRSQQPSGKHAELPRFSVDKIVRLFAP